jgi:serine carboxypeptidase-like clade 2
MAPAYRTSVLLLLIFSMLLSPTLANSALTLESLIKLPSDVVDPNEADLIKSLPGSPELPFRQYSGYITVDEAHGRALFYWFVEAVEAPLQKPVTLW